jgi:hypothetical protein
VAAEEEMRAWVDEYLEEIQKIEIFFNTKFLEYSHEFDMLKHAFLKKKYGHTKHFNATARHARFARHDTNNNEDPSSNAMLVIPNFESMSL